MVNDELFNLKSIIYNLLRTKSAGRLNDAVVTKSRSDDLVAQRLITDY